LRGYVKRDRRVVRSEGRAHHHCHHHQV